MNSKHGIICLFFLGFLRCLARARLAHEKVLGIRALKNDASGLGRHMEK